MPEGKVGDLVRITDASICSHSFWRLYAVYRVIDVDPDGYYLENILTSRFLGYLWANRVEIIRPIIKSTHRLTVIGNGQENDT